MVNVKRINIEVLKKVDQNTNDVIINGVYQRWGKAKSRIKILNEVQIKTGINNIRKLTEEEKKEFIKEAIKENLIELLFISGRCIMKITTEGKLYIGSYWKREEIEAKKEFKKMFGLE